MSHVRQYALQRLDHEVLRACQFFRRFGLAARIKRARTSDEAWQGILHSGGGSLRGGGWAFASFQDDLDEHRSRLSGKSEVITTSFGQLEYATRGTGQPLLMIHGTGGGFDQALTFTEGIPGFRVIAPSRFGYLRSDFPADPSSARQAAAFVELLDRLRIDKVAVAGGSAGALSAVEFAHRYPDRTSALVLIVPAANVRGSDPVDMTVTAEFLVRRLTTSDFMFWSAAKVARKQMIGTLLGTDPAIVGAASSAERLRAYRILNEIMPVSYRWRGMLNDAKLAGHPAQVEFTAIKVPTLVISVGDDRFGTARSARDIAEAVPGAKLVIYPTGGHIWVGHDQALWREVGEFVDAHMQANSATPSE